MKALKPDMKPMNDESSNSISWFAIYAADELSMHIALNVLFKKKISRSQLSKIWLWQHLKLIL